MRRNATHARPEDVEVTKALHQGAKVLAAILRPRTAPLAEVIDMMKADGVSDAEIIAKLRDVQARLKDIKGLKIEGYAKHLADVARRAFTSGTQAKRKKFATAL